MQDIIIRAICFTLLHSLWQGLLLAVAAAVLMLLTKQSGSAIRYKLLCLLMIIFIAVVSFTFIRQISFSINPVAAINSFSFTVKQLHDTNQPAAGNIVFSDSIQKFTTACTAYFNQYSWLLVLIWFAVFLFHFVQLLLGMVNAERMRYYKTNIVPDEWNEKLEELCARLQITKSILLMESALLKVPVLIGYVKPVILVPVGMMAQLSAEQVEAILLHELAHVRRHDYLVNLIQNAIDTLFFFNPAVLWMSSLIRAERENCCDDIAISETKSRKQFIEALVSFNQYSNTVNNTYALSWATGKSQLLHRVQRIVTRKNDSLRSAELIILLAVLLLTGTAFITLRHTSNHLSQIPKQPVVKIHKKTIPAKPALPAPVSNVAKPKEIKKPLKINTNIVKPVAAEVDEASVEEPVPIPEIAITEAEQPVNELGRLQGQLGTLGFIENNPGRLQTYKDHGVSAGYIESILAVGYHNVSLDLFLQLKDHGVHANFLDDLKKQGYGTIPLEKAITLVDHGVSVIFIESFRQVGFKNLSLEEAITLKDHGVNSAFIESFKKKTGQLLLVADYIKLKDTGINPV
jgi:bla regulator protein BlaR1